MTYDLRVEPWIPLRRASGVVEWCAPSALTDGIADDPFVEIASPRADFDAALTEFLIGLLAAALEPGDDAEWQELWEKPPAPVDLQRALAKLPPAFDLIADGPAFFQDYDRAALAKTENTSAQQMLLDAPGDQTKRQNKDLFIKRAHEESEWVLGLPAAAMALLTLQTYAPSGGKGHRVSLRGGGPLTTLVDPRGAFSGKSEKALWYLLWANVPSRELLNTAPFSGKRNPTSGRFPWLAATRTSEGKGGTPTYPDAADPLQAFFGLPRRIRLEVADASGVCAVTGLASSSVVTGYQSLSYGTQYQNWRHPLSPYYQAKDGGWLPEHGQPDGVGWRDWVGLVVGTVAQDKAPAAMVVHFRLERGQRLGVRRTDVIAFGYDFDNMKARSWVSGRLPLYSVDEDRLGYLRQLAQRLVDATDLAARELKFRVRDALFGERDISGDGPDAQERLWGILESDFYAIVGRLADTTGNLPSAVQDLSEQFYESLRSAALAVFDGYSSASAELRRVVAARYRLTGFLRGYGASGAKLFEALGKAQPESKKTARAKTKRAKGNANTKEVPA